MEESNSTYGKRRRNLLIAGIIVIVLYTGDPDLSEFELFSMQFNFDEKPYLIWIGIFIWFIYALYRVYTYYNTYLRYKVKTTKRLFIYGHFIDYWRSFFEDRIKEIKIQEQASIKEDKRVRVEHERQDFGALITSGDIPGQLKSIFVVSIISNNIGADTERRERDEVLDLKPSFNIRFKILKRRLQYLFHDDWGEHVFLILISLISLILLVFKFLEMLF